MTVKPLDSDMVRMCNELGKSGEHICCIYRNKKERDAALVSFFSAGLKNNEKCLLVMDECTEEEVVRAFESAGVEVKKYLKKRQLELLKVDEAYLKDGYFDPDRTLEIIRQTVEAAVSQGYQGLRGAAEASWSLRKVPGSERQMEYEAKINKFLPQGRVSVMCLYNERKFPPETLLDVIYTHPKVILRGSICDNPNFIRPSDFL
ncbi:MAG: MEDS domain-containing protein, partial [Candidatus Hadarchaeum sp.]